MPAQDMPAAEIAIDVELVRALLVDQQPDLATLPIEPGPNGWDNALFRLGDELVVRLPRREAAVALVTHEQRWLPYLAPNLPLPVPAPIRAGTAGPRFPWPWSICAWHPGDTALAAAPADLADTAVTLGSFLAELHRPAPPEAPTNPYRGVPLPDRTPRLLESLDALGPAVDRSRVLALWEELAAAGAWAGPSVWVHGDLHPGNLIVHGGRLSAVVDFGDLTAGDPAVDLSVAWMLLPPEHRASFREAAGAAGDDELWARARGWALALGLATSAHSADNPTYAAHGHRTVAAALAG